MPRRRARRRLTEAESELWASVARSARRLHPEPPPAALAPAAPPAPKPPVGGAATPAPSPPAAPRPPAPPRRPAPPSISIDPAPDPLAEAAAAPARIDRRAFQRMMRGKSRPEARIDLHGMTRPDAHAALIRFVLSAQERGLRLVLVITGKGRVDIGDSIVPERHGVLRHSLPHWLAGPPLTGRVAEWRPAHARHGGSGAVYLYLRRR